MTKDALTGNGLSRRNHLRTLVVGGGMTAAAFPAQWVRPTINATFLPAHANMTIQELECGTQNQFTIPGTYQVQVPEPITSIQVTAGGAQGGAGGAGGAGASSDTPQGGGGGGVAEEGYDGTTCGPRTLSVSPGDVLTVVVGDNGGMGTPGGNGSGEQGAGSAGAGGTAGAGTLDQPAEQGMNGSQGNTASEGGGAGGGGGGQGGGGGASGLLDNSNTILVGAEGGPGGKGGGGGGGGGEEFGGESGEGEFPGGSSETGATGGLGGKGAGQGATKGACVSDVEGNEGAGFVYIDCAIE